MSLIIDLVQGSKGMSLRVEQYQGATLKKRFTGKKALDFIYRLDDRLMNKYSEELVRRAEELQFLANDYNMGGWKPITV